MKGASFDLILGVLGSVPLPAAESNGKDIVQTAVTARRFKALIAAVHAAGLDKTFRGPGPYTLFAPTDDAFKKLPEDTLNTLLKPESKETLKAILLYHAVPGSVSAAQAMKISSAKTLNGQELSISSSGGSLLINGATALNADIQASNGVIHAIDAVLLPEN